MLMQKEFAVAFIVICVSVFANAERVKRMYALCPPNFIRIGSECYYVSSSKLNWLDAHFDCKDRNSRLAEPLKYEDRSLRKYFMHSDEPEGSDVWIGGIYNWERKKWQWGYHGRNVVYQSFSQMSPGSSQDLKFHCAVLNHQLKYRWAARSCVEEHHYICQHAMPYVNEKNRVRVYDKWNSTYPNQKANQIEVVLTQTQLQQRQQSRMQRQRQRQRHNARKNRNQPNNGENWRSNSLEWQQQSKPNGNNRRQQGLQNEQRLKERKLVPRVDLDVDNNIGDINNNRVSDREFNVNRGYDLQPRHGNRTRNHKNNMFGRRERKHKHTTRVPTTSTTTPTTTTTTTTTEPPTEPPTHPPFQVDRYRNREPTSEEERTRVQTEQIRLREQQTQQRKEDDELRQREYDRRERYRLDREKELREMKERENLRREEINRRERKREEELERRINEERERLQREREQSRSQEDTRDRSANSVELPEQPTTVRKETEPNEEKREPIDDLRIEKLRKRKEMQERFNNLTDEEKQRFLRKRMERHKKRGAAKREDAVIPN